MNKEAKRRMVKIRLCDRKHTGKVVEPYRIMEEIIATDRQDLAGIKIGIAWHVGWRPDADGVRTHGKCAKRSDLDRSLDGYDVIIILNEKSWLAFGDSDKLRLITHELEHVQIASDKNGEPLIDDKGRQVIRMKRHDLADFARIIQKFGLPPCLTDVQIADADRPLLKLAEAKAQTTKGAKITEKRSIEPDHQIIPLQFKGLRGCFCQIMILHDDQGWRAGYEIKAGNLEKSMSAKDQIWRDSRVGAIQVAKSSIQEWIEQIEISGSADAKRSMNRRLTSVCEQVDEQLDPILNAAEEFAEDDPENKGKDADADQGI